MRNEGDFWVGDRLVRPSLGEIRAGLEKIHLEPRSMAVLVALAERPRQVVSKDDLIRSVWGEAFVSDDALANAVWQLRRALGDKASSPEFIQTIPKRGYRLIAPVTPHGGGSAGKGRPGSQQQAGAPYERLATRVWLPFAGVVVAVAIVAGMFWLIGSKPPRNVSEIATAYRDVWSNPRSRDRDIRPWISTFRQDIRAIRDFLFGMEYVYRGELGGAEPMDLAIKREPDFVGPKVWRTPGLVARGDVMAREEHRQELERLSELGSTSSFEKAMIRWAQAIVDNNLALQMRHLSVALEIQPDNRIVRINLAGSRFEQEDFEGCWKTLEPLVEQKWCFPGLYVLGAECALGRGSVDDARVALESAFTCDPVDPTVLALLELLAEHRGDPGEADHYRVELKQRIGEMDPEPFTFDRLEYLELIAGSSGPTAAD